MWVVADPRGRSGGAWPGARETLNELVATGRPSTATSVRVGYFSQELEVPGPLITVTRVLSVPAILKDGRNLWTTASLGCLKWEVVMSLRQDADDIEPILGSVSDADRLLQDMASVCHHVGSEVAAPGSLGHGDSGRTPPCLGIRRGLLL